MQSFRFGSYHLNVVFMVVVGLSSFVQATETMTVARVAFAQRLTMLATRLSRIDKSGLNCSEAWHVLRYLQFGADVDKADYVIATCVHERSDFVKRFLDDDDDEALMANLWITVLLTTDKKEVVESQDQLEEGEGLPQMTARHVLNEMGALNISFASSSSMSNTKLLMKHLKEYKKVSRSADTINVQTLCSLLTLAATLSEPTPLAIDLLRDYVFDLQRALWKNHFLTSQVDESETADILGLLWMLTGRGGSPEDSRSALVLSLCVLHSRLRVPDDLVVNMPNAKSPRSKTIMMKNSKLLCEENTYGCRSRPFLASFGMLIEGGCQMRASFTESIAFHSLDCDSMLGTVHTTCRPSTFWRLRLASSSSSLSITTQQQVLDARPQEDQHCWQVVPKVRHFGSSTVIVLHNPNVLVSATLNTGRTTTMVQAVFDETLSNTNRWTVGRINNTLVGIYSHRRLDIEDKLADNSSLQLVASGSYNLWIVHIEEQTEVQDLESFSLSLRASSLETHVDFTDIYLQCLNTYRCLDNGPLTLLWCLRQPRACPIHSYVPISPVAQCLLGSSNDTQSADAALDDLTKCLMTTEMDMWVKWKHNNDIYQLNWDDG